MSARGLSTLHEDDAISSDIELCIMSLMDDHGLTRRRALIAMLDYIQEDDDAPPRLNLAFLEATMKKLRGDQ